MNIKEKKGITLIALVITIIVLLVLAGVTIAFLVGENGILSKSETAKIETKKKGDLETVRLEVAGSFDKIGKYNQNIAAENLEKNIGATILKNENKKLEIEYEGKEYKIDKKGNVTLKGEIGKPDSKGYFTETSTINGEEASYINPKVPAGFKPISQGNANWGNEDVETTEEAVNNGLVIEDRSKNEFVWIPVQNFSEFERIAGYTEGNKQSCSFTSTGFAGGKYYEPVGDGVSNSTEAEKMYKSVKENGGFYIGRYEAGFKGDKEKAQYTSYTTKPDEEIIKSEAKKIVVKPDSYVYNYVPWGASMNDTTAVNKGTADSPAYVIGAVELSQNFANVNNYTGVTSTLCYGVQWDAVMKWLEKTNQNEYLQNSTGKGWYAGVAGNENQKTGIDIDANASNKVNNIYDMAGNVFEWTMEAHEHWGRVYRGGDRNNSGKSFTVGYRASNLPVNLNNCIGFRITLHLST